MLPIKKEKKEKKGILVWVIFLAVVILLVAVSIKLFYVPEEKIENDTTIFKTPPLVDDSGIKSEAYKESLKDEASDIEGLSKYEKYEMGLDPRDGSDSDGDGLTDKEEIELYNSDPLKKSTSGDLYEDSYKIANGMDINTSYEYEGVQSFKWNECDEVQLKALSADDFYAVVQDITKSNSSIEDYIIAEYRIYNFSGSLTIDTSYYENLSDDMEVLIKGQNDIELEKVKLSTDGAYISLEYLFDNSSTYELYITKSNASETLQKLLSGRNKTSADNARNVTKRGHGLIFGPSFFGLEEYLHIWVEDIGEYTEYEKKALVDEINRAWFSGTDKEITSLDDPRISVVEGKKIEERYKLLKKIAPIFECSYDKEVSWWFLIYAYQFLEYEEGYDHIVEEKTDTNETVDNLSKIVNTGFNIVDDEFPFANFGSYISPGGNCAGISHFTTMLFNQGYAPSKGYQDDVTRDYYDDEYHVETLIGEVKWDISTFDDTQTLLNRGISDYKDARFLQANYKDYYDEDDWGNVFTYTVPNYELLEADEQNFVDMIGDYQYYANTIYTNECIAGSSNYSYQTIERMKEYLDTGEVIKLATNVLSGGNHMIVVYGYEYNENMPDQTIFYIYDSNLPNVDKDYCNMVVTRTKSSYGYEDTFSFDYWPDPKGSPEYRLTSYVDRGNKFYFEVTDDDFNILNVN